MQFAICANSYAICLLHMQFATCANSYAICLLHMQFATCANSYAILCLLHMQFNSYAICLYVLYMCLCLNNLCRAGSVFLVRTAGIDFAKAILFILLVNLMMYLAYYSVTKCVYREVPSFKPIIFTILAFATWVVAIYFFTQVSINLQ